MKPKEVKIKNLKLFQDWKPLITFILTFFLMSELMAQSSPTTPSSTTSKTSPRIPLIPNWPPTDWPVGPWPPVEWPPLIIEDGTVLLQQPVGHADIVSAAYIYKQYLQKSINEAIKCDDKTGEDNEVKEEFFPPDVCLDLGEKNWGDRAKCHRYRSLTHEAKHRNNLKNRNCEGAGTLGKVLCDKSKENEDLNKEQSYTCSEYPIGRIMGEKKYIMTKEGENNWQHFRSPPYKDKSGTRTVEFPIEMGRSFPDFDVPASKDFILLNANEPGSSERDFSVSQQSLGETLVSITPKGDRLYIHTCEFLPGTYLLNKSFRAKYTYLKFLFFSLSVHAGGKLGGVDFDALKICALLKVNNDRNNKLVTSVLDVQVPSTYNLKRVPLEVKILSSSWIGLFFLAVFTGGIFLALPGMFFTIMASIMGFASLTIAIVGIFVTPILSDIATKYINSEIDSYLQNKYNVTVEDFNSEVWAKKLEYDEIPYFAGKSDSGSVKDGSWAATVLNKNLLKDQMLLGLATAQVSYSKYFESISVGIDQLTSECRNIITTITTNKNNAPPVFHPIFNQLISDVTEVCNTISSATVVPRLFVPLSMSKKAGCYDSYIRFQDVEGKRVEMLEYLEKRLSRGSGVFNEQVRDAVLARLNQDFEALEITNWWAEMDSKHFCGFDNIVEFKMNGSIDVIQKYNLFIAQLYKIIRDFNIIPDLDLSDLTDMPNITDLFIAQGRGEIANVINIETLYETTSSRHTTKEDRDLYLDRLFEQLPKLRNDTESKEISGIVEDTIRRLRFRNMKN